MSEEEEPIDFIGAAKLFGAVITIYPNGSFQMDMRKKKPPKEISKQYLNINNFGVKSMREIHDDDQFNIKEET